MTREPLCHGCDTTLGPDRYCPSCGEVMPVYRVDAEPFLKGFHPGRVDQPSARRAI